MNDSLRPPRDRELPSRQRRRAELLAAISAPPATSSRRVVVPLAAAASVIALTAGGAFATQAWQSRDDVQPQSSERTSKQQAPRQKALDAEPAPDVHDLRPNELSDALQACDEPAWAHLDFEAVVGVRFETQPEPLPDTFLTARAGDRRMTCALRAGRVTASGLDGPGNGEATGYLFGLVDSELNEGAGRYASPVAKVTVQPEDGKEREAVRRDGQWFLPLKDLAAAGNDMINVPFGYTIRGYDANGELVYDSDRDAAPFDECYADPDGERVLVNGGIDPDECRRMVEWRP